MTVLKGWRTVIANALMALVPVLEMTEVTALLPSEWEGPYMLVMVAANLVLRMLTTTPVGRK